jgi:1-acyl-sn-glycerol-3-phosphate acyltransferase
MANQILRALSRLLLSLFYRRIEVLGGEHIPGRGPLIIAANHHNSLVDPMLIITAVRRRLVILAAAPLFRAEGAAPAPRRS